MDPIVECSLPAAHSAVECAPLAPCSGPARSRWLSGTALQDAAVDASIDHFREPVDVTCRFVDLLADSLRELCDNDGERMFPLLARVIDLHLADSVQSQRTGRWMGEAMDAIFAVVSPELSRQFATHLAAADGHTSTLIAQPLRA